MRIETLDLEYQGIAQFDASFLIHAPEGPVLVETGPGSTLPTLLARLADRGIAPPDVGHILLTHIHLDHGGAAGWWAQQGATIYVHEFGAPHLVDPSKLIASATRIYGDQMQPLWGDILPAPADRVVALTDGDVVEAAGLTFTAIYTPGHAGHHHAYRLGDVGFVGDAAGIRGPQMGWIDLPAPPPEFDLELWKASIERLRGERFETIYRTHFGPRSDVDSELDGAERVVERAAAFVHELLEAGVERDELIRRYRAFFNEIALAGGADPASLTKDADEGELLNPRHMSVDGISRYWRKRSSSS